MNKGERCLQILSILQEEHQVEVGALARQFQTSEMTIRRDLNFLAEQYNVIRTHGGAKMEERSVVRMISFDENRIQNKEKKEKIAEKAVSLIRNGQRIFIDAGSTTRAMLNYIDENMQNVVVTNHLKVAECALAFDKLSVVMLGGEMLKVTNCTTGPVAEEQIKQYSLDAAFLGAGAIGADGKLYDGYSPEAGFKSSILPVAEKVYILVDSSKFHIYNLTSFASLSQVDGLITDDGISEEGKALVKKYGVDLIIAD